MPKVLCPRIECKHNKNETCKAKEVNIRAWHINTVYEGFKRMEECMTFEMSEEFKEIMELIEEDFKK